MISGILMISVAFVAAVVSAAAYALYYKQGNEELLTLANRAFYVTGAGIVLASLLLLSQILMHNFQVNYVYSYSSRELPIFYLVSTFWAGQEGTFLLWLFLGTIYGLILIRTTARANPLVMTFHMMVQAFILFILLKKNPFAMIWHVHEGAPVGFMPADGAGLNPLLQNPWMVVHPPTLFVGYSSTMVIFAFAMSAMLRKKFREWVTEVRPWVIFTVLVLGAGIILGGYWAYVTLGWGGYWGWDPVENSSLVPWLLAAGLLHGIIIQKRQNGLVRTNLLMAGLVFITVLWGSFLTRSGVLTDFSVHSFAESGLNFYLTSFVVLFAGLFLFFFFRSFNEMKGERFTEGLFSRETFMFMGMATLILTGFVVLIGTSAPIYTGLFGKPSNVSVDFYNKISIPVAFFLLATVGLAPLLAWKVSELRNIPLIIKSTVVGIVMTIVGVLLGMREPISIILFFLSVVVIAINGVVSYRLIKKNALNAGGYLAHVGVAFMIIGIITSSVYDKAEKVVLPKGQMVKSSLGYELQFLGFVPMPDGKDRVKLRVRTANGEFEATPKFYYSDYTKSYMVSPDVQMALDKDIYISPVSYTPANQSGMQQLDLGKNESESIGNLNLTFKAFDVQMDEGAQVVKAILNVKLNENNYQKEYEVVPALMMENGQMKREEVTIPGTDYRIAINAVDASRGRVQLAVRSNGEAGSPEVLAVEVSEKPFISVLWFGTIVLIIGAALSLINRSREIHQFS